MVIAITISHSALPPSHTWANRQMDVRKRNEGYIRYSIGKSFLAVF
jgi:hypothetical protein